MRRASTGADWYNPYRDLVRRELGLELTPDNQDGLGGLPDPDRLEEFCRFYGRHHDLHPIARAECVDQVLGSLAERFERGSVNDRDLLLVRAVVHHAQANCWACSFLDQDPTEFNPAVDPGDHAVAKWLREVAGLDFNEIDLQRRRFNNSNDPVDCTNETVARSNWEVLRAKVQPEGHWRPVLDLLLAMYATPPRAYHNLDHILECLAALRELSADPPIAAELAIWFHDAVYIPDWPRNEIASAELCDAYAFVLGFDEPTRAVARAAILATTHDAEPPTDCARLVVDADLSILAAEPERYDAYRDAIRREWSHVGDADFRRGRAAILTRFLERDTIYTTVRGRDLYEIAARQNLEAELARLQIEHGAA